MASLLHHYSSPETSQIAALIFPSRRNPPLSRLLPLKVGWQLFFSTMLICETYSTADIMLYHVWSSFSFCPLKLVWLRLTFYFPFKICVIYPTSEVFLRCNRDATHCWSYRSLLENVGGGRGMFVGGKKQTNFGVRGPCAGALSRRIRESASVRCNSYLSG